MSWKTHTTHKDNRTTIVQVKVLNYQATAAPHLLIHSLNMINKSQQYSQKSLAALDALYSNLNLLLK